MWTFDSTFLHTTLRLIQLIYFLVLVKNFSDLPLHHILLFLSQYIALIDVLFCSLVPGLLGSLKSVVLPVHYVVWKLKPGEMLGPLRNVKAKFESQICGESYEIIKVIRGINPSDCTAGSKRDLLHLVIIRYDVVFWQDAWEQQQLYNVKHNYSPAVSVKVQGNLDDEVILDIKVFVKIGGWDPDNFLDAG